MKKTTRELYMRTDDIYYDGIEWGTRIGTIKFIWINNDNQIEIYHNDKLINTTKGNTHEHCAEARSIVNKKISDFLKDI